MGPGWPAAAPSSSEEEASALRAAMLSVRVGLSAQPTLSGPQTLMSLTSAVNVLQRATGRFSRRARSYAVSKLAEGMLLPNSAARFSRHEALVRDLIGRERAAELVTQIRTEGGGDISQWAYRLAWGGLDRVTPSIKDVTAPKGATATFDPTTFISTAVVSQTGKGKLELLPALIDPRGWTRTPFWLAAMPSERRDGRWVPRPLDTPLGTPWKGYMFEYVVFNTDGSTVSGFQVILNVDFAVPRNPDGTIRGIYLAFSLFQPLGNLQLMRVATGGMELDCGGSTTQIDPRGADSEGFTTVTLSFTKSVRFTDILSRDTPGQGDAGTGNVLNTNAPAMLGVWMEDLVYGTMAVWAEQSGCGGSQ